MQEFIHNIAALFKVKTIISLVCIFVFAYLAITQVITPDNVMVIVSMVVAFYFGTQSERKNSLDKNDNSEYYVTSNTNDGNNGGNENDRTIGY